MKNKNAELVTADGQLTKAGEWFVRNLTTREQRAERQKAIQADRDMGKLSGLLSQDVETVQNKLSKLAEPQARADVERDRKLVGTDGTEFRKQPNFAKPVLRLIGNLVDRIQVPVEDGFNAKDGALVLHEIVRRLIRLELELEVEARLAGGYGPSAENRLVGTNKKRRLVGGI